MKKFLSAIFFVLFTTIVMSGKEIKLLNVGNSFSWSLSPYLANMVEHEGKHKLVHWHCSAGGCELRRHWRYVELYEKNGEQSYVWDRTEDGKEIKISLKEALQKEQWDVITVQQASHESWRPEYYQPYGSKLVEYIHQYAPQATLFIQQTWAYRADSPRLTSEWHITQQEMYDRLTDAYQRFSDEMGLPLIPVGKAVQLARQRQAGKFVPYDIAAARKLEYPQLPDQKWEFINGLTWKTNADGTHAQVEDYIHLNARGRYLQALVWYGFLYGEDPLTVTFCPEGEVEEEDAAFLRGIASEVLKDRLKEKCPKADCSQGSCPMVDCPMNKK